MSDNSKLPEEYMFHFSVAMNKISIEAEAWNNLYALCHSAIESAIKDHSATRLPIKELSDIEKER